MNAIFCAFRNSFGPDSDFLCQFLYFFKADDSDDFLVLVQICRLLWWFVQNNGNSKSAFHSKYSFFCIVLLRKKL